MEVRDATSGVIRYKKIDISTIMDSCRICMARNVNMSGIFDMERKNIIDEILFCTGVSLKKEDGLPTKICAQCLGDLSIAYKFKTSCILADETFHKLVVDTSIKAEVADVSEVEYEEIIEYEEELVDHYVEKVKVEVELGSVVMPNVNRRGKVKKEKAESALTKPVRRVGRPKSTNPAVPRRLKKFKFKKLHCESCNIKFDNKQQCDEHKKQMHKDSETWVCEICGKLFIHRASHYTHIKSHLPPKYGCDQCEYKTWHKYDLVKHIRIHTGIKMYQCEYCTASYYTSSNLTGHIRRNHMKQRPFECTICHMTFFDRSKLNRHIDSHNEVKSVPRFECEVCHACFSRRCYWKKHLLRQHDIVTPPQRPGRQKINAVVGEDLIDKVDSVLRPGRKIVEENVIGKSDTVGEYLIGIAIDKVDKEV